VQEAHTLFGIVKKYYPHFFHFKDKKGHVVYYEILGELDLNGLRGNGVGLECKYAHVQTMGVYMIASTQIVAQLFVQCFSKMKISLTFVWSQLSCGTICTSKKLFNFFGNSLSIRSMEFLWQHLQPDEDAQVTVVLDLKGVKLSDVAGDVRYTYLA
jgi:hypothetical protein